MINKSVLCLLASICVFTVLVQPAFTAIARISCSRTVRNVTFNANATFQIFQSPSYPRTYLSDVNCTYLFKAQEGHRIELSFSAFHLEGASPICDNDYIVVRDGPSEKSPLINRFCGPVDPKPIISSKNSLYLYFVSNEKFVFDGFNGTYRVISEVEIARCTRGRTIAPLFSRGYITSPTFPAKYPPNSECSWTLEAPPGHFMKMVFRVFQTQCPDDKVIIRDNDQTGQLLGQFCGEPEVPVFRGRKLWVSFKSDKLFASGEDGFNATYEALPFKGHISDHCTGGQNKIINASTPGTIKSPWRPDFYPNNMNCVWKIRAPKGKRVKLTFDSFDLESPCDSDFVEVSDITVEDTSPKGKFCGNFPDTTSTAEDVLVRFVTDSRGRQKGFVMQYKAVNGGLRSNDSMKKNLGLFALLMLTVHYGIG